MKRIINTIKLGSLLFILNCSNNSGQKEMLRFGDVSKGYTDKELVNTAPVYRRISDGLNLEADCQNCYKKVWAKIDVENRYKGKKVYSKKKGNIVENGFNIGLIIGDCYCSNCNEVIKPENVNRLGFHKCKYFIYGRKHKENNKVKVEGEILTENEFRHFNVGNIIEWASMEVAVWK